MKTDIQKQSNKINAIVMIVVLVFTALVAGSVVIALNIDNNDGGSVENSVIFEGSIDTTVDNEYSILNYLPDITYVHDDESNVKFALSNDLMVIDPEIKAVPVSEDAIYSEFRDNSGIYNYIPHYYWTYTKGLEFYRDENGDLRLGVREYEAESELSNFIIKNSVNSDSVNEIQTKKISLNLDHLNDIYRQYAKVSDYPPYLGDSSFKFVGSGIILKLIDDDTGDEIIVEGYDFFDVFGYIFLIKAGGSVHYCEYQSSLSFYDLVSYDRAAFDPNNMYPEFDRAEFYSYGDSFFEICTNMRFAYRSSWENSRAHYSYMDVPVYGRFRIL